jgi:DNA repair protein RecN (Recombination protein N)
VLRELRVENLLLIDRAELRLAPGLNVLTGETGAGKTVLAHALDLMLGGRPRAGIVRPGAAEAYVEGVFDLPDELRETLGDRIAQDADELVLARRVGADGRTRALLNGRSANLADLRAAAEALLSFYGQHEHRKLTLASAQLELLDAYCGDGQAASLAACAAAHAQVKAAERALEELSGAGSARERELDLVAYELREIEDAAPDAGEERELLAARERLRHVESLRAGALGAEQALDQEDGAGALALLSAGGATLDAATGVDAELDALSERWRGLLLELTDLASELRGYAGRLDADPAALDAAEQRLAALDRLKRKHGGTIEAVLEHAERCRARKHELENMELAIEQAEALRAAAVEQRSLAAAELRAARAKAAPRLATAVAAALGELAMEGASFELALSEREPGPSGADAVEFLLAPNSGVRAAPVREAASGGELSRVMLALLGVAGAQSTSTLVFDEVDAGIGGQTARAVGARLRALAHERQVLCITHLPQIASLADRHFSISKDARADPALTTVSELAAPEVVGEIVRMLGADASDAAARRHARELLKAA